MGFNEDIIYLGGIEPIERDKMTPDKKKVLKGHKIEQFYWAGRDVVYIDNHLTIETYDAITASNVEDIYKTAKRR